MKNKNKIVKSIFGFINLDDDIFVGWFETSSDMETFLEQNEIENAKLLEVVSVTDYHLPPPTQATYDKLNLAEELNENINK